MLVFRGVIGFLRGGGDSPSPPYSFPNLSLGNP